MKHLARTIIAFSAAALMLAGCDEAEASNQFGEFSFHGMYLRQHASKKLTFDEAKAMLGNMSKRSVKKSRLRQRRHQLPPRQICFPYPERYLLHRE